MRPNGGHENGPEPLKSPRPCRERCANRPARPNYGTAEPPSASRACAEEVQPPKMRSYRSPWFCHRPKNLCHLGCRFLAWRPLSGPASNPASGERHCRLPLRRRKKQQPNSCRGHDIRPEQDLARRSTARHRPGRPWTYRTPKQVPIVTSRIHFVCTAVQVKGTRRRGPCHLDKPAIKAIKAASIL